MREPLRVILVEDSASDAELVVHELRRYRDPIHVRRVEDGTSLREAIGAGQWDLVIADWSLPSFSAPAALRVLKESGVDIPFIIVSGEVGEELAVEAMLAGAHDFVLKDKLARLPPAVEREIREGRVRRELATRREQDERFANLSLDMRCIAGFDGHFKRLNPAWHLTLGWTLDELLAKPWLDLVHSEDRSSTIEALSAPERDLLSFENRYQCKDGRYRHLLWTAAPFPEEQVVYAAARDITERKQAEEELRRSETRHRAVFEHSPLPMWVHDMHTLRFVAVNDAAVRKYGYCRDAFLEMNVTDVLRDERDELAGLARFAPGETVHQGVWRNKKKDKSTFEADITTHAFVLDGRFTMLVVAQDVSERMQLEAQLRQSQKMEAIGSLAGGIAHDFNNLLSVILSYSSLILNGLEPSDSLRPDVDEIHKAGARAADLARQLLAFSRQQVLQPKIVDLNQTLAGMEKMLRSLLQANVNLTISAADSLGSVRVDPGQIEQVIMNLVVNAKDAMPQGGTLTIATANVRLDEAHVREHVSIEPGGYVLLTVTDTGIGMNAETRARIFEPFFTTKEKDKGTGLGLSTALGIVQQSGGHIDVRSDPGRGTTFTVYLPRTDRVEVSSTAAPPAPTTLRGSETVLLVEDDEQVRVLTRAVLEKNGYKVLEAQNGGEAFLVCEQYPARIQLLLTDVVMPRMNGRQLSERLIQLRPEMRVLYMSGFTDRLAFGDGVLGEGVAFLQKPITPEALLRKVRDVLGS